MVQTQVIAMPSYWASAIVNHDYSGLTNADIKELNNYLLDNGLSFKDCLSVGDTYTGKFNGLLCTVSEYTFKG
jgi:hypothetical protein